MHRAAWLHFVPERVLVIDDEDAIRDVVASALEDEGYEVERAHHGAEALQLLERDNIRAILLDMRMPVMDGWQFAQAYRQRPAPHAPIIVMTAAQHAREWCAEVNADACLPKPFELDALIACVEKFVRPPSEQI